MDRVLLDHGPLVGRQRPGLAEYCVGNGDLADVVERARHAEQLDIAAVEPALLAEQCGVEGDPLDVAAGLLIAQADHLGEPADRRLAAAPELRRARVDDALELLSAPPLGPLRPPEVAVAEQHPPDE